MKRLICLLLTAVILVLLATCIWLRVMQIEALESVTNEPAQTSALTFESDKVLPAPSEASPPSSAQTPDPAPDPAPDPVPTAVPTSLPEIRTDAGQGSVHQQTPGSQPLPVQTPAPTAVPPGDAPQGEEPPSDDSGFSGNNELPEIST